MLMLTEAAAGVIRDLEAGAPAGGLRIVPGPRPGNRYGPDLQAKLVEAPHAEDAVLEAHGAHVFLQPAAGAALEDKVLDADVDGNRVSFAVFEQTAA
jgi:Fe-S cluster assembly iron-binding protein IscA